MFIQFISPLQMENLLHNSITNTNYSNHNLNNYNQFVVTQSIIQGFLLA